MLKLTLKQIKILYDIVKRRNIYSWHDLTNNEKMGLIKLRCPRSIITFVNEAIDDIRFKMFRVKIEQ
jgi:hypothetical protein